MILISLAIIILSITVLVSHIYYMERFDFLEKRNDAAIKEYLGHLFCFEPSKAVVRKIKK